MGSNQRYGAPSERAAARKQQELAYRPQVPRTRHVWVKPRALGRDFDCPGLVVEWRRDKQTLATTGWMARVAYIAEDHQSLIVAWVAAEQLLPLEGR